MAEHRWSRLRRVIPEPPLGERENRTVRRESEANVAIGVDLVDRLSRYSETRH